MTDCTYFSSTEWEDRASAARERTANAKVGVWASNELVDSEQALRDVVAESDYARQDLSTVGIHEVLSRDSDGVLTLQREDPDDILDSLIEHPETCPHDAVEGTDRCLFHMSLTERKDRGISDADVRDAFLENVRTDDRRDKIFVGARFGDLNLGRRQLSAGDNFPIRMEACHVAGAFNLRRANVEQPLFLTGSTIGSISSKDASFREDVECSGADFEGVAEFTYADFESDAEFWNTTFESDVSFYASSFAAYAEFRDARFLEAVQFKYTHVARDMEFWDADFRGEATFDSMVVENAAEFRYATFQDRASFKEMSARRYLEFEAAQFGAPAEFYHLSVGGNAHFWATRFDDRVSFLTTHFEGYLEFTRGGRDDHEGCAHFGDDVTFRYSTFAKDVEFWCVTFEGDADFRNTTFRGTTEFHNSEFHHGATFDGAIHDEVYFTSVAARTDDIDLTGNELPAGIVSQPSDSYTQYDLSEATIGDVDLEPQDDPSLFRHIKFYRTEFDGFDFPDHRRVLNKNWNIHEWSGRDDASQTPDELETTYLKAKNGASAVGDTHAASEFFVRERKWQRKSHFDLATSADSLAGKLDGAYRWTTNWLYNLTCGYGERPFRTVGFGLLIILLFTGVFWATTDLTNRGTALSYLTFSVQTFVALLIGEIEPASKGVLVQFLTAFEAFIGGFVVALFVFSLTKSIQR